MPEELIPITLFIVTGFLVFTYIYFKSREKQMLIEKGLSADQIKEFFENKKKVNPYLLSKIGIISIAFGIALFFGMMLEDNTGKDYWMVLSLFAITGLGFILANNYGKKTEERPE